MKGTDMRPAAGRQDRGIDLWLRQSLCSSHDDVLSERLPEEWLAMVQRADRRR